jgi:hypothetical protein
LFESVGEFDETRFGACHAGEADAVRARPRLVARRKRRRRRIGDGAEWHDDRWVSRLRGDRGATCCGKQKRVEVLRLHDFVDAVTAGERDVFLAIGFITGAIAFQIHLVGDIEL